ncbi:MAG: U32 family peptidase [Rhodocyclaceae bacterium]|nr:U32 family peptidase [Rhodocyclaceae bacterium]
MNSRTKPLELLAPAKTAAIGREAVLHGADAVYIGGPAFGARHAAGNDIGDIARLVEFAHRFHVRIYVTLNTILHDDELEPAHALVRQCWDAGVDALIVQDMGLLDLDLPPIDLHASTQCDIRTPEKARFLADAGFSQLVLARELTLEEIARVRAAVPEDVVIEHFVHGALCVAYSGQCYISHAQTGRSANRGDCSQACRLPYTLEDDRGRVVAFEKHLLSLKDNNQSAHLAALVDAGVASFKIEGRYKEAAYVKNITGHYRRLIDALLEGRPDLQRASSGRTTLFFTPDPDKTFHRGATDYFSRGRQADIGAFDAPAFVGLPLGTVARVGPDWIEIATREDLGNGDGLNWLHKRRTVGAQANRVERLPPSDGAADPLWRVWPNEPLSALPGLKPGLPVNRNRDHAWEQALLRGSAERRIAIHGEFAETPTGYRLRLTDADGIAAEAAADCPHEDARVPGHAAEALRGHLDRFGATDFALEAMTVDWTAPRFVPASLLNRLRRDATERLEAARLAAHSRPRRRPERTPPAPCPDETLGYLANVYNRAARDFYARHGVRLVADAFEAHREPGEVSLMITRHCLRYSFSLCPKQAKGVAGVQGQVRAEPMTLVNGKERLTLLFDCRKCEMHVMGRIRPGIRKGPPPGQAVAPVTFHPRAPGGRSRA